MTTELEPAIHRLLVDPDFLELEKSGRDSNLFETLAVSHMEMWHSAFIKWILDSTSYFGLGDFPLKRFLFLVLQAGKESQKYTLSVGDLEELDLDEMSFETELTDEALLGAKGGLARIDIIGGQKDIPLKSKKTENPPTTSMRIIIENKIKALESTDQTLRYYEWAKQSSGEINHDFFIFLTPVEIQTPECSHFTKITYQQFCDFVIKPCLWHPDLLTENRFLLKQYLVNLKKTYIGKQPMAYPNKEICKKIYDAHKDVLDEIFSAVKGESPVPAQSKVRIQRLNVNISQLVSSNIVDLSDTLHARNPDNYSATFKKNADGKVVILFDGKEFDTPSGPAKAILKQEVNGWTFWDVKDAQGVDKGLLADLRDKHIELQNKISPEE
jgi:hypothetical protein